MNKLMKRLALILVSLLLVSALTVPVFASEDYCDAYYEDEYYDEYYDDMEYEPIYGESITFEWLFWIFFGLIGFLVPAVLIAGGLILPRIKKFGEKKYWYILTATGGVWLLLGIAIAVTVLVI